MIYIPLEEERINQYSPLLRRQVSRSFVMRCKKSLLRRMHYSLELSPRKLVVLNEMCAESLGTFIILFFGTGSGGSGQLNRVTGAFEFGLIWGFAVVAAILASAPVSSAHLNPAVTLAVFATGKLPLWKIPHFLVSQFLGAFAAAGVVYSFYWPTIAQYELAQNIHRGEPGSYLSGKMFYCSLDPHISAVQAFYIEWFVTSVFLVIIGYLNDRNATGNGYGPFFPPLMVGFTVAILTASFSPLTGTCMNPARDLAPRLVTYLAGWRKSAFPGESQNPWWPFVAGPILGGLTGACFWEFLGSKMFKFVANEKRKVLALLHPSFDESPSVMESHGYETEV